MTKKLVSVIIPTYNRAKLIQNSIESVLNQTMNDFECIIVDDGSTDNTEDVVRAINDPRIRYIKREKNEGACHARNVGIEHAVGQYIAFQDSDDYWYPDKLEIQLQKIRETGADYVVCQLMNPGFKSSKKYFPAQNFRNSHISIQNVLSKNFISTQTLFVKRECLMHIRFDDKLGRFQDWDLAIRLVKNYKGEYDNKVLVERRLQKDSISRDDIKGCQACEYILHKYEKDYAIYRRSKAKALSCMSTLMYYDHDKRINSILIEVLKYNPFYLKGWAKLFLYKFGLRKRN